MSWRTVVISKISKLDYQMGYLVVRGEAAKRIHINEISTLIVENPAVSMTGILLSELVKSKVKVIFCDEKRNPLSELLPYYGSHDTSLKVREQVKWDEIRKKEVWALIVKDKITKQAELLSNLGKSESEMLMSYVNQVEPGDSTNREGHAAKVYFNALFGMQFTRSEDCPTNAALNYGYSLLLSMFNREVALNGYITQIGLFHDNMFNQFNLGSDLMEPFRPLVDEIVYDMKPDYFEIDEKRNLLKLFEKSVKIAGREEILENAVKIYTRSVFDCMNCAEDAVIRFYEL